MGLNIDDYQDEGTWIRAVRGIQVSEGGPVRTSASKETVAPNAGLTTYTVSNVMQGMAFYKPKGATLDLFNQVLSKDFEGLKSETDDKFGYKEKTQLSPYDTFTGKPTDNPLTSLASSAQAATTAQVQNVVPAAPTSPVPNSAAPVDPANPSIMGGPRATAAQMAAFWSKMGYPDPSGTVQTALPELVNLYLNEGAIEGVAGDLAFVQAIHETGGFNSPDAKRFHNFAGIGHPDGAENGNPFPDTPTGVRAQIQLLKKVAMGNNVVLANPDVSPNWGIGSVTTWPGLAGTWASDRGYWTSLNRIWQGMLTS